MSERLDELARSLASDMPRRRALRLLLSASVGAAVAGLRPAAAGAISRCPGAGEKLCKCPSINGLFYEVCCPSGYRCSCVPPPGGAAVCSRGCAGVKCAGRCCAAGDKCCYEDHCCRSTHTCCGSGCCAPGKACCGDHCCDDSAACCGAGCCPAEHTCVSVRGDHRCCPSARTLSRPGGPVCCPPGSVASGDRCCPANGKPCTPCDPACRHGEFCNDGYCLPV